jgi:hypothetical protein
MNEKTFMAQVMQLARVLGWRCYHTHDSRRSAAGFPDLVLVRERVIYAELKSDKGTLKHEQEEWLDALRTAGQEAWLWRPADWEDVVQVLTRKQPKGCVHSESGGAI